MESLTKIVINGETCVNRIRAMTETYVSEADMKCRNCRTYENCRMYLPVKTFEIPLNPIRFSIWNKNVNAVKDQSKVSLWIKAVNIAVIVQYSM